MARKRKNKDDDIRHISGLPGLINKIVMFITFPFRKPIKFLLSILLLCAFIFIIPILLGVKPTDVCDWYIQLIRGAKQQEETVVVYVPKKGTDFLEPDENVSYKVKRQVFMEENDDEHRSVDVLKESAADVVDIKDVNFEDTVAPTVVEGEANNDVIKNQNVAENARDDGYIVYYGRYSSLDYVQNPINIEGAAKVHNVNELSIDDTYMFLYGIYSNPLTEKGVRGREFLKELVKDNNVYCKILAYTKSDKIATAVCYVGEDEINKLLVDKGYSTKVEAK